LTDSKDIRIQVYLGINLQRKNRCGIIGRHSNQKTSPARMRTIAYTFQFILTSDLWWGASRYHRENIRYADDTVII